MTDSEIRRLLREQTPTGLPLLLLTHSSDALLAYAHGKFFFPELVRYRGAIFLAERFTPASVDEWFTDPRRTSRDIERVVNHIHLAQDQFPGTPVEHIPAVRALAGLLKVSWPFWARHNYGWDIVVEEYPEADDIQITFVSASSGSDDAEKEIA